MTEGFGKVTDRVLKKDENFPDGVAGIKAFVKKRRGIVPLMTKVSAVLRGIIRSF